MTRPDIVLGTARLGSGRAPVAALLEAAAESGVTLVDTAPEYGDAERVLGRNWPFPSPFRVSTRTIGLEDGLDRLEARARRSVERMGLARVRALIVRSGEDLLGPDGPRLWDRVRRLKDDGLFEQIGISVSADCAPMTLARRFRPDLVQAPVSLLDQRLVRDGTLEGLAGMGVRVQLHSVFLHGLLFTAREALAPALAADGPRLSRIRRTLAEARVDPMHAALAFALSRPEASAVVVSVASPSELRTALAAAALPCPRLDWAGMALEDPVALDPRLWSSAPTVVSNAA